MTSSTSSAVGGAKKKSVRFTSDTKTENLDKENLIPSEDELMAVTPKSAKKTVDKLQESGVGTATGQAVVSSFKSSLKRRLDDEAGERPGKKVARTSTEGTATAQPAVVVVEKWESLAHLNAHFAAPHMAEYRTRVKEIVQGTSLQILEPAAG